MYLFSETLFSSGISFLAQVLDDLLTSIVSRRTQSNGHSLVTGFWDECPFGECSFGECFFDDCFFGVRFFGDCSLSIDSELVVIGTDGFSCVDDAGVLPSGTIVEVLGDSFFGDCFFGDFLFGKQFKLVGSGLDGFDRVDNAGVLPGESIVEGFGVIDLGSSPAAFFFFEGVGIAG